MTNTLGALAGRIAAAPISWGICEVPGWGEMMPVPRVLDEMSALGLHATELGAPGFLPSDPPALRAALAPYGIDMIGGFVPLVLHDRRRRADALERAEATAVLFESCGAGRFVTAAVQDDDWTDPEPLDAAGMTVLGEGLAEVDEICRAHGLIQALHPHIGTLIETARDVRLALAHTDVGWCLDTGHLFCAGVDPVAFARENASRVTHVHLKDVDSQLVSTVMRRESTLLAGVRSGLFRHLGAGDVDIVGVIDALESAGYRGWYVLEQDTALTDGLPADGTGPVDDVRASLDYLRDVVAPRIASARR